MKHRRVKRVAQERIHQLRHIRRSQRTERLGHEFQSQQHLSAQRENPAAEAAQNRQATIKAHFGSGQTTTLDGLRVGEASHATRVMYGVKEVFAERLAPWR